MKESLDAVLHNSIGNLSFSPLPDDPSILDGTYLVRLSAAAQERLEIVAEKDLHDLEPMKSVTIDDIRRELAEEEEDEGSGLAQYAAQIEVETNKDKECAISSLFFVDAFVEYSAMLPSWDADSARFAAAQKESGRQTEHPNKRQQNVGLKADGTSLAIFC